MNGLGLAVDDQQSGKFLGTLLVMNLHRPDTQFPVIGQTFSQNHSYNHHPEALVRVTLEPMSGFPQYLLSELEFLFGVDVCPNVGIRPICRSFRLVLMALSDRRGS